MKTSKDGKGRWKIDFRCKGRRIIRVVGPSKREAEAEIVRLKAESSGIPTASERKRRRFSSKTTPKNSWSSTRSRTSGPGCPTKRALIT